MKIFTKAFPVTCLPALFLSGCANNPFHAQNKPPLSPEWQHAASHLIAASLPDSGDLSFQENGKVHKKTFLTTRKPWEGYYSQINVRKSDSASPWVPYSCFLSTQSWPPINDIARYNIAPPKLSLFYTIMPKEILYSRAYSHASIWDIFGHARENDPQSNDTKHNETTTRAKIAMFPDTTVKGKLGVPATYFACIAGTVSK